MAKRSLAEYEKLQSDKQAMINQLNGKLFAIYVPHAFSYQYTQGPG